MRLLIQIISYFAVLGIWYKVQDFEAYFLLLSWSVGYFCAFLDKKNSKNIDKK